MQRIFCEKIIRENMFEIIETSFKSFNIISIKYNSDDIIFILVFFA